MRSLHGQSSAGYPTAAHPTVTIIPQGAPYRTHSVKLLSSLSHTPFSPLFLAHRGSCPHALTLSLFYHTCAFPDQAAVLSIRAHRGTAALASQLHDAACAVASVGRLALGA